MQNNLLNQELEEFLIFKQFMELKKKQGILLQSNSTPFQELSLLSQNQNIEKSSSSSNFQHSENQFGLVSQKVQTQYQGQNKSYLNQIENKENEKPQIQMVEKNMIRSSNIEPSFKKIQADQTSKKDQSHEDLKYLQKIQNIEILREESEEDEISYQKIDTGSSPLKETQNTHKSESSKNESQKDISKSQQVQASLKKVQIKGDNSTDSSNLILNKQIQGFEMNPDQSQIKSEEEQVVFRLSASPFIPKQYGKFQPSEYPFHQNPQVDQEFDYLSQAFQNISLNSGQMEFLKHVLEQLNPQMKKEIFLFIQDSPLFKTFFENDKKLYAQLLDDYKQQESIIVELKNNRKNLLESQKPMISQIKILEEELKKKSDLLEIKKKENDDFERRFQEFERQRVESSQKYSAGGKFGNEAGKSGENAEKPYQGKMQKPYQCNRDISKKPEQKNFYNKDQNSKNHQEHKKNWNGQRDGKSQNWRRDNENFKSNPKSPSKQKDQDQIKRNRENSKLNEQKHSNNFFSGGWKEFEAPRKENPNPTQRKDSQASQKSGDEYVKNNSIENKVSAGAPKKRVFTYNNDDENLRNTSQIDVEESVSKDSISHNRNELKTLDSHFLKEQNQKVQGFNGFSNNVKVSQFEKDSQKQDSKNSNFDESSSIKSSSRMELQEVQCKFKDEMSIKEEENLRLNKSQNSGFQNNQDLSESFQNHSVQEQNPKIANDESQIEYQENEEESEYQIVLINDLKSQKKDFKADKNLKQKSIPLSNSSIISDLENEYLENIQKSKSQNSRKMEQNECLKKSQNDQNVEFFLEQSKIISEQNSLNQSQEYKSKKNNQNPNSYIKSEEPKNQISQDNSAIQRDDLLKQESKRQIQYVHENEIEVESAFNMALYQNGELHCKTSKNQFLRCSQIEEEKTSSQILDRQEQLKSEQFSKIGWSQKCSQEKESIYRFQDQFANRNSILEDQILSETRLNISYSPKVQKNAEKQQKCWNDSQEVIEMVKSQKKLVAKEEDKSSCQKNEAKVLMSQANVQQEEENQPKQMCPESELSPLAKEWIIRLNEALEQKDGVVLSELVFDCECEDGLALQIDLKWYDKQAQKIIL